MKLLDWISDGLMLSKADTKNYISTIPRRYKVYTIKKRNSEETRLIAHPSKPVKALQRAFYPLFKDNIPVHECAFAYQVGKDIKMNAEKHAKNKYLLKMDFKNFFLCIQPSHFMRVLSKHGLEVSKQDEFVLSNLFFWKLRSDSPLRLSIGAPSSPFISNAVMYFFDEEMSLECERLNITYTRYADDLTFSTNKEKVLFNVVDLVKAALKKNDLSKIKVNDKKTVFSSKKFNRHVTGVTLNNDGQVSLGRDKKRKISAKIHDYKINGMDESGVLNLKGELGFAKFIEPDFLVKMSKKYGEDVIRKIQKFNSSQHNMKSE